MWTKVVGEWGVPGRGVKRAKRTQFGPAAGGRRRRNLRNEPNLAPAAGVSRSQNAQNEPNLARRDTGCPDRGVRCEVSSVKSEKSGIPSLTSHFKHQTSHFPTANRAKQDAHDKSRSVAVPSSIPMQEGRFSVLPGTFVVGVKQTQFAGLVQYRPSSANTPGAPCGWHGQTRLPVWPRMNRAKPDRTVKQVWRCHPARVLPAMEPGLFFRPCRPVSGTPPDNPGRPETSERGRSAAPARVGPPLG
jgi:hypothetical protein